MIALKLGKVLALGALLSACGNGDGTPVDAGTGVLQPAAQADGADGFPSIKAVLVIEELMEGKNIAQDAYTRTVEICREAGYQIEPLTSDQIARLGTRELTLAMDGKREYIREVRWSEEHPLEDPSQLCLFRFKEVVAEYMRDGQIEGTGETGGEWSQSTIDPPGALVPIDINEERAGVRSGWDGPVERSIQGHTCDEWVIRSHGMPVELRQRACVWTGGARWGIPPVPDASMCGVSAGGPFDGPIPLSVEPLPGGHSCRLTAKSFSVGVPLDETEFVPRKDYGGSR